METDSRPILASPRSFPASSASPVEARPLKRTLTSTSDLEFFKPAESSFNPRPYAPGVAPSSTSQARNKLLHLARTLHRQDHHLISSLNMDPSPADPNAIFIHPPFNDFPGSRKFSEGLTFKLLAENPEWFLDVNDYVRIEDDAQSAPTSQTVQNTSPVPYPPHLEPPRGWCPAKKKNLKELGADSWPEGEEPRLRCTFCRRTYAGVNAKSMWRRHVFEKHKIAMSNRRENSDRPRGRGSMKENKPATKGHSSSQESLVIDMAPQLSVGHIKHKIRFRPAITGDPVATKAPSAALSSTLSTDACSSGDTSMEQDVSTPPLTPSQSSIESSRKSDKFHRSSTPPLSSSPYDPSATPAFRHSPAPTPYDQPWRYPSPSHPFSKVRDLSLSVLLRNSGTFSADSPGPAPGLLPDDHSSPNSSLVSKKSFFVELDTPDSISNKRVSGLKSAARLEESPLGRNLIGRSHRRNISDLSLDNWPSPRNPFLALDEWDSEHQTNPTVAHGLAHGLNPSESPVVRRDMPVQQTGLGIGLLAPFTLPGIASRAIESSDIEDEFEIMDSLTSSRRSTDSVHQTESSTPPPKRRRISSSP
ncbi:hypothetical protein D9757_002835 [Collybiopsis confluens]|uniref:Uncharacterized protein n=1 Tax=Collybiopsis confluens TaxID=2823264 RepID=A0A8H5HVF4_9AGAR|nr:hypothetical protein D9757_002835 [Collybiopsis confluens]